MRVECAKVTRLKAIVLDDGALVESARGWGQLDLKRRKSIAELLLGLLYSAIVPQDHVFDVRQRESSPLFQLRLTDSLNLIPLLPLKLARRRLPSSSMPLAHEEVARF